MKELQPVNQNVILKVDEVGGEQKTASGIIIPDTVEKEKPKFGEVTPPPSIRPGHPPEYPTNPPQVLFPIKVPTLAFLK